MHLPSRMKFFSALRAPPMPASQAGTLVWKVRANAWVGISAGQVFATQPCTASMKIVVAIAARLVHDGWDNRT